jgi:hypothetical protein
VFYDEGGLKFILTYFTFNIRDNAMQLGLLNSNNEIVVLVEIKNKLLSFFLIKMTENIFVILLLIKKKFPFISNEN